MEGKSQKKIIISLIVVCVVLIGVCVYLLYNQNKMVEAEKETKSKETKNSVQENVNKEENIKKLTNDEMIGFYNKINIFNSQLTDLFGYYYRENAIEAKAFENKAKLLLGFSNLIKGNSLTNNITISKEQMDASIKSILGPNVEYLDADFIYECMPVSFANNQYTLKVNQGGCGSAAVGLKNKVISVEQNGKNVIVKEKMMIVAMIDPPNGRQDIQAFGIYKDYNFATESLSSNYIDVSYYDGTGSNEISIDSYLDKLSTYQYTFTLNTDGNYYISKIEKI